MGRMEGGLMSDASFKSYDISTPIRVLEVFNSIDGEQPRMGEITTFVRLAGCNLKCDYCDTPHSQNLRSGEETTVIELVKTIHKMRINDNITITGGEPLLQMIPLEELCHRLKTLGYSINIETNGSIKPTYTLLTEVDCMVYDYKAEALFNVIEMLRRQDIVKFVIRTEQGFDKVREIAKLLYYNKIYVGCVQGEDNVLSEKDLIQLILAANLPNIHFNTQLHKKIEVA